MKTIWLVTDKSNGEVLSIFKSKVKATRFYEERFKDLELTKLTWNGGYYCKNPAEVFTGFMDAIENKRFSDMF